MAEPGALRWLIYGLSCAPGSELVQTVLEKRGYAAGSLHGIAGCPVLPVDNIDCMPWTLVYLAEYENWRDAQEEDFQDEAATQLEVLKQFGPKLGRPRVDTLKDSKLPNLKEVRFFYKGAPIRILLVFDPKQQGEIILAGDKSGDKRWYKTNIPIAEKLYAAHLEKQKKEDEEKVKEEKAKKEKGR